MTNFSGFVQPGWTSLITNQIVKKILVSDFFRICSTRNRVRCTFSRNLFYFCIYCILIYNLQKFNVKCRINCFYIYLYHINFLRIYFIFIYNSAEINIYIWKTSEVGIDLHSFLIWVSIKKLWLHQDWIPHPSGLKQAPLPTALVGLSIGGFW